MFPRFVLGLGRETTDNLINQEIKTMTINSVYNLAHQYLTSSQETNILHLITLETLTLMYRYQRKNIKWTETFLNMDAKVWNSLLRHAKQASSKSHFKSYKKFN